MTPEEQGIEQRANVGSEVAVLGYMLENREPACTQELWSLLSPEDFYLPKHEHLARVLYALFQDGEVIDPVRVLQEIVRKDMVRVTGGSPGYLHDLMRHAAVSGSQARWHAQAVVDQARLREAHVLLQRTQQRLSGPDASEALGGVLADLEDELYALKLMANAGMSTGTVDFLDFLEQPDPPLDFVIEGLLARRERAVITGGEGLGKSTFMRQMALCTAAGLHPFTRALCEPRRVLWVDVENPEVMSRRKFRGIYEHSVMPQGRTISRGMLTLRHPRGLSLLESRDVAMLMRMVTEHRPDLLVIGPLYKVAGGSLSDEDVADRVIRTLDQLAGISDAALLLEAHAGHSKGAGGTRDWRPRGSSILLGWPDFGFGLGLSDDERAEVQRIVDVHSWRGERHTDRAWPRHMMAGSRWPWEAF